MRFEYSTLLPLNPVSQTLISRFYAHHDTPYELPKALTTDCCLNPDSNVCTHSGRHLWQAPMAGTSVPPESPPKKSIYCLLCWRRSSTATA